MQLVQMQQLLAQAVRSVLLLLPVLSRNRHKKQKTAVVLFLQRAVWPVCCLPTCCPGVLPVLYMQHSECAQCCACVAFFGLWLYSFCIT